MELKSLLCTVLLVSIVSAVPCNSESSRLDVNAFSMQSGETCLLSGACEICQSVQVTVGSSTDYFHVCPDDGDPCNPKLCYYSSVCRCRVPPRSSLKCNSTTTLLVEGKTVKVTHYIIDTPGTNVPDEACFTTEPFIDSCSQECNLTCSSVRTNEPTCNISQNIYFLLDGTKGNNEFCSMAIIIQMLVAAFNPTASLSGTRISTVLFPNGQHLNASVVFGTQDTCDTIVNSTIRELQQEFQKCRTPGINYDPLYSSFCGEGTSAVDGLKTIYELIPSPPTTNSAVVILTDGIIRDDPTERSNILAKLKERRVYPILAAGIEGAGSLSATDENLKLYTFQNRNKDAILRDNVIDVGVGIVARMNETGIICPDHAANVISTLRATQNQPYLISDFCACHKDPPDNKCRVGYPKCNGPLSISYNFTQMDSVNLEKDILAAVETVLEKYEG